MVVCSGWSIYYNTDAFDKSDRLEDLSYRCVTSEGIEVHFRPTKQGLHVLDCTDAIRSNSNPCVFGKEITDNGHITEGRCANAELWPIPSIAVCSAKRLICLINRNHP